MATAESIGVAAQSKPIAARRPARFSFSLQSLFAVTTLCAVEMALIVSWPVCGFMVAFITFPALLWTVARTFDELAAGADVSWLDKLSFFAIECGRVLKGIGLLILIVLSFPATMLIAWEVFSAAISLLWLLPWLTAITTVVGIVAAISHRIWQARDADWKNRRPPIRAANASVTSVSRPTPADRISSAWRSPSVPTAHT